LGGSAEHVPGVSGMRQEVDRLRGHVLACPCGARMGRHAAAAVNIARRGVEFLEGSGLRGRGRWATPVAGPLASG
jgi:transposase